MRTAHKHCAYAAAAMLAGLTGLCQAQQEPGELGRGYPVKPIRMLVGVPPGSGADIVARAVAAKLGERWDRSVVADNRTGAGGTLAMDLVAHATPDGYTILVASVGLVATATLLKKVAFEVRRAYTPVVQMTTQPYLLIVYPSLPVNSVKELIAYAKTKPGTLNYATSGVGTASHLGMELFKSMAGVDIVHVPYKGVVQGITDLIGGQIQVLFGSSITATPFVHSGKVRAIAVTSSKRAKNFPDLPTVTESGVPGFTLGNEYSLFAPAGTPAATVLAINRGVNQAVNSPDLLQKFAADGAEPAESNSPAQFKAKFEGEVQRWEKFFKTSNVKFN